MGLHLHNYPADRKTGTTPGQGTFMTSGDWDYAYDNIGNREDYTEDSTTTYYCPTDLNWYKYVGTIQPNCATVTPNLEYDADGNLTGDGMYTYYWDMENRLTDIITTREGGPV